MCVPLGETERWAEEELEDAPPSPGTAVPADPPGFGGGFGAGRRRQRWRRRWRRQLGQLPATRLVQAQRAQVPQHRGVPGPGQVLRRRERLRGQERRARLLHP